MRPPFPNPAAPFPQAKVCGVTRLEDALVCAEAGVSAIGINFWPGSKRHHPLAQALRWLREVPLSLTRVAVLVNAEDALIEEILASGEIDLLQFHGDETPERVRSYSDRGVPCLRATALRTQADVDALADAPTQDVLLDAYAPGIYGGSGHVSDWALAAAAVRQFPGRRFILSGGIHPGNAAEACAAVHPAAIDVASGVESAPGIKDAAKVRALMSALHSVPN